MLYCIVDELQGKTMLISGLNHVNIATNDLEASARFYENFGLKRGHRPTFPTKGIWLYSNGCPILHLNDAAEVGPIVPGTAAVHHVGLSVNGSVEEITRCLRNHGIEYDLWDPIPGVFRALYFKGPSGESVEFVMLDEFVHIPEGE